MFFPRKVVSESKIARKMLCFIIETAVRLCEGRRCKTAVADMVAYARVWSDIVGSVRHWEVQAQVVKRIGMVGCRWRRVRDGGAMLLGNRMAGFHGGAVLLGNVIAGYHGDAALLGHGMAGFHGGAVLLGNGMAGMLLGNRMAGFHGGAMLLGDVIGSD